MAYVTEEIEHEELPVKLMTAERDKESGECREPWRFISLEFDLFESLTPPELRRLGRWLVREGKRIGKEYKYKFAATRRAIVRAAAAIGEEK